MAKQLTIPTLRKTLTFRDVVLNPSPGHSPAGWHHERDAKHRAGLIANQTDVKKVAGAWRILVEVGGSWYYFSYHGMLLSTSVLKED